ncbi:hypothetical protein AB0D38_38565, partial [Streptomyces sp. NPDC048279]
RKGRGPYRGTPRRRNDPTSGLSLTGAKTDALVRLFDGSRQMWDSFPVIDGRPALGTWQSVCLVDTNKDNTDRQVRLSFLG